MVGIRVLQDINKNTYYRNVGLMKMMLDICLYFNMRDKPNWILYVVFFNLIVDFMLALYTNLKCPVCP